MSDYSHDNIITFKINNKIITTTVYVALVLWSGDKPGQEHILNSSGGCNCMNCFRDPDNFLKFINQSCIFNHNKEDSYYYYRNFSDGDPTTLIQQTGYHIPQTSVS